MAKKLVAVAKKGALVGKAAHGATITFAPSVKQQKRKKYSLDKRVAGY